MAFNTTQRERQRAAARDLALKIKLERDLLIDTRDLFDEMARDMRRIYRSTGEVILAVSYQDDLQKILKRHYQKVARNFNSQIRMAVAKSLNIPFMEHKVLDDDIKDEIDLFIDQHSITQAQIITNTNQEDINTSINRITQRDAEQNNNDSDEEIAAAAADEFNRLAQGRSVNIATTETQGIAERAKFIEAAALVTGAAVINSVNMSRTRKEWVAILDNNTRLDHAIADGAVTSINDPFTVGGEALMTPGDSSLGASASNLCNCRCSAVYSA